MKGSRQLGKPISQHCCVCWQISPLSAQFPLFRATVRNIGNLWDAESNCQSSHRRTRKAIQRAMLEDIRDLTVHQSWGEGWEIVTPDTQCAFWSEGARQCSVQTAAKLTFTDASQRHYALVVYRWDCLPLPPTYSEFFWLQVTETTFWTCLSQKKKEE